MKDDFDLQVMGDILDRLLSVPVYTGSSLTRRPVLLELYEAARKKAEKPLTYLAAKVILEHVKQGSSILITTGFIVPPWLRAELDGPVGAATLARTLNLGFDATPVIVTESKLVEMTSQVCRAAGFEVVPFSEAHEHYRRIAVEPFTVDKAEAAAQAKELLDRVNPSVVIAIEKASANEVGEYHSGVGYNLTPIAAKVDYLIDEARRRGIPTIGIGDGGNEIGMGYIKDVIKQVIPTGANCGCPCGKGTHAATQTDVLIVAAVSNWGATALEAMLAYALEGLELLHDRSLEEKLLEEGASAGFIDPAAGFGMSAGDAIDKEVHLAVVDIMNFIIRSRLKDSFYIRKYKYYVREQREHIQRLIASWRA